MATEFDALGFEAPAPVGHPGRAGLPAGRSTGPAIGERLPDLELPDAYGRALRLHEDRGDAQAVVVFYRSAVW